MPARSQRLPIWMITNAWREILTRIFEDIGTQFNVSPEWLVNPATNRKLKLDLLYPEIGVAVRLEGLQGKQRKQRLSLEEEIQARVRSDARIEACRAHGIQLISVDLTADQPQSTFQQIDQALSRAAQITDNAQQLPVIKKSRATASALARKIGVENDLKLYADLWQDRQYQMLEPAQSQPAVKPTVTFSEGMEVEHTTFGPGVILSTSASNGDTLLTVDFITAGTKTLAASLVADKLVPR